MTKIKNFRIQLRTREVIRTLKTCLDPWTPEHEAIVSQKIEQFFPSIQTAALYTTLTRSTAEKATSLPLSEKAIAVSVVIVGIGPLLDDLKKQLDTQENNLDSHWISAIQSESLHQSMSFAMRLLTDQAKEEECMLGTPIDIHEALLVPTLSTLLGIERIGLQLDTENPQLPSHVRLAWIEWTALPKKTTSRKSAAAPTSSRVSVAAAL